MEKKIGDKIIIHSYKHNKSLHRIWKNATILEDNEDYIVVANKRTKVVEATGRFWYTREPSVSFFFKNHWYNVIAIIKKKEVTYYCNVGSPVLIDDEALKYIDYDLDIKVNSDFTYKILDVYEYKTHQKLMNYPEDIKLILAREMLILKAKIDKRSIPFNAELVLNWYDKLLNL
jgi:uncharacterized protein